MPFSVTMQIVLIIPTTALVGGEGGGGRTRGGGGERGKGRGREGGGAGGWRNRKGEGVVAFL